MTGFLWKCSPAHQEAEGSRPIRDQGWAEFTNGCLGLLVTVDPEPDSSGACGSVASHRKCCIRGRLMAAARKWPSSNSDHGGLNMESERMRENLCRSGRFVLLF